MKRIIFFLSFLTNLNCVYTVPAPALTVSTCENSQSRIGVSGYTVLFGLFKFGDGSITAAMNEGGIDSVHHVDIKTEEYLLFRKISYYVVGSCKRKKF